MADRRGSQLIARRMAAELGKRVRLSCPVRRITQDAGADSVTVHDDSLRICAQRVIVAIPPTLAGRIDYQPPLPGFRDQLCQRYPQGSVIKFNAVYPKPFWRLDGLSGQVFGLDGPVKVCFDNSPPSGTPGVIIGFLEGNQARELGRRPASERRSQVLTCLERYFGSRAAHPDRYLEQAWAEEEWTRGCYAGYLPPGGWTGFGPAVREPIGRIHWAGAETATVWNGYMDGAISAGERAAGEVDAELSRASGVEVRDHRIPGRQTDLRMTALLGLTRMKQTPNR